MGKKDKKSKSAEQKARVAAKQNRKATQKDVKSKSKRNGDDDSDADNVDLESVLEEYAKQQAQILKVIESSCEPPSPRSSSMLIGSPSNANELFLFGGEHYNGALATFYNDLFVYLIDRSEWRKVTSPNSPLPRSGHAWCRGGNSGGIYLFGGEFSSPKQGTFYHYNDFWRLDTTSREWTRIECKKGPLARSGHRMTFYKNYIILFGGFQDTSQQTKYLQDLWLYDCESYVWYNPVLPPATQKPDARSSFSFLPHDSGAVIYGGYSRVKSSAVNGKQNKNGTQGTRAVVKPMIHQDSWFLRIAQPPADAPTNTAPTVRWERRKKPANSPNPPRAGATMTYHKGRGIMFGGVHDVEESEEGIESEFFDGLYAWNVERNRYFQLTLRKPRAPGRKQPIADRHGQRRGRGKADEAELLRNLAALETKGSVTDPEVMVIDTPQENENDSKELEPGFLMTMPHPRFNAQLAVSDDVLFIFGGTYEHGDREYTFDEMWSLDLGRLNGVRGVFKRELENWQESEEEESGSEDADDDYSEDEEVGDGESSGVMLPREAPPSVEAQQGTVVPESEADVETEPVESIISDSRPYPRPFESLRDFFARTSAAWQDILLETLKSQDAAAAQSVKGLRKEAFDQAERKWWDCREEITALEDEQEEAGIGEVVSLADKGSAAGATGRRR